MAQSYTRQSTFADGDTITASLFNNEYDQLVNAFSYSSTNSTTTGHRHDGTVGEGGNIGKIGDLDFLNKIEVDDVNNRWGVYVEVTGVSTEQVRFQDGSIVPVTTNDIDLGSGSLQFKDLFIDGTASIDSLALSSGSTVDVILDEDDLVSDSATALATQQSIKAYVDSQVTAQDLDVSSNTGTISIDLDSETLTFVGGTGIDTAAVGNDVLIAIDSTVATLTDAQTLTNKTIDASLNTLSNIANSSLTNSTVSYGGVQLSLGGIDATPAFNLVDATGYLGDSALVTTGALNSGSITSGFGSIDVGSSSITTLGTVSGGTLTGTLSTAAQANVTSLGTLTSLAIAGDLTVDTSTLKVDSANNRVGILNAAPDVSLDIGSATDAVHVPVGTTAQRPGTPAAGYFRYNADLEQFEGYTDTWGAIGGGGTNTFTFDSFTGDNVTVDFVLSQATNLEGNLIVFIDGVFQTQDAYTIATASGITTLTFSAAPATGRYIAVYTIAAGVSGNNMNLDSFSGDGATTDFTLSINAINENNTQIFIDGVYQQKDGYTVTNTTLSFSAAPPLNSTIEVMTFTQTEVNVPVDNTIEPIHIKAGDFYFDTDTLYIDSVNNRVGVGTASPSHPLQVRRSGGAGSLGINIDSVGSTDRTVQYFSIQDSATGAGAGHAFYYRPQGSTTDTFGFILDESGNVGIGTNSPDRSGFAETVVTIAAESNNQRALLELVGNQGTSNSFVSGLAFTNDASTATGIGKRIAQIHSERSDSDDEAGNLVFATTNTGGTLGEAMRIDSSGNVGIGTTSPTTFPGFTTVHHKNASGDAIYLIESDGGIIGQTIVNDASGVVTTGSRSNHPWRVTTNDAERMRIDSAGNVGIGTDSPSGKFHVNTGAMSGAVYIGNNDNIANGNNTAQFGEGTSLDFLADTNPRYSESAINTVGRIKAEYDKSGADSTSGSTALTFSTYSGFSTTGTLSEAMRIDSAGNTTFKADNLSVGPIVTLENTAAAVNGQAWGSIHFDSNDSSTGASGTRASIVGTSTSFNGDGNLDFYTAPPNGNNTFAARIDSAGNVGIGTTSPTQTLTVLAPDNNGIQIESAAGEKGYLFFGDDASNTVGRIGYDHGSDHLDFWTNSTEAMRIDSAGHAIIPAGVTLGTAAGTYNAANTLDDYEEGTWTPAVNAGSISGTSITYSGTYTKVGRLVHIHFKASNATGDIQVGSYVTFSGLPFTINETCTSTVVTEDVDQFSRQGFAEATGTTVTLSACGSATGTNSLFASIVAYI